MSTQTQANIYYPNDEQCGEMSCNGDYATLAGYNQRPGPFVAGPPVPSQTNVGAVVIVPSYGGVGYSTLQNNLPYNQLTGSGYFTVNNAYPSQGNNCQKYTTALAMRN